MADAWKKLNEKVRAKWTNKDPPKDHRRRPKGEELTVQRLSAEVSRKAQKYTRIGAREFVPFDESEEMTIGNIKSACERYFKTNLVCDILAGKQGPSCKTLSQMPDLKVVYGASFQPTWKPAEMQTRPVPQERGKSLRETPSPRRLNIFFLRKPNQAPVRCSLIKSCPHAQEVILSPKFINFRHDHDHDHDHCEGYGFQAGG